MPILDSVIRTYTGFSASVGVLHGVSCLTSSRHKNEGVLDSGGYKTSGVGLERYTLTRTCIIGVSGYGQVHDDELLMPAPGRTANCLFDGMQPTVLVDGAEMDGRPTRDGGGIMLMGLAEPLGDGEHEITIGRSP